MYKTLLQRMSTSPRFPVLFPSIHSSVFASCFDLKKEIINEVFFSRLVLKKELVLSIKQIRKLKFQQEKELLFFPFFFLIFLFQFHSCK